MEETRSEILDEPVVPVHEDEEEIDDDMRHFKETIENWNLHTETFPLPIQPVCPTLRPVEERNEDDEPFIMFSHDILVYCYDAPELTYDEHFSKALPDPWRLQFWVRGRTSPSHFGVCIPTRNNWLTCWRLRQPSQEV